MTVKTCVILTYRWICRCILNIFQGDTEKEVDKKQKDHMCEILV